MISQTNHTTVLRHLILALVILLGLLTPLSVLAQDLEKGQGTGSSEPPESAAVPEDPDSMTLKGDEESTVLRSLTIEGEDRIQIEFERPILELEIDSYDIEGLRWGTTMQVVQRREVDPLTPMLHASNRERPKGLARPWLRQFREGSVARFRPDLEGVASWKLTIADSRGDTVRVFSAKGSIPEQIAWDGVYDSGKLALPGLTYSYVLEARDKAGNRRNFVGPGFEVAPYRIERGSSFHLIFSGKTLLGPEVASRPAGVTDPWLLEAASWLSQYADAQQTIEIHVSARNFEMAEAMGEMVRVQLSEHLAGSPLRLRVMTEAQSEAPPHGVVSIGVEI